MKDFRTEGCLITAENKTTEKGIIFFSCAFTSMAYCNNILRDISLNIGFIDDKSVMV